MSKLSKFIDKSVTHKSAYKSAMRDVKSQMDSYAAQKETLRKAEEESNLKRSNEERLLREKQIRVMQRSFRRPGFMQEPIGNDLKSTLS